MKSFAFGFSVIAGLVLGAGLRLAFHPAVQATTGTAPTKARRPEAPSPGLLKSSDSLETLKDTALPNRAVRVALWLPQADLPEVMALWEHLLATPPVPEPLGALVMARWVELDPQGAIAGNGKTGRNIAAWRAWAAAEPRAAEAAARASGDRWALAMVLEAIAGRDPDYVLKQIEGGLFRGYQILPMVIAGFIAQRRYDKALDAELRLGGIYGTRGWVINEWVRYDPGTALLRAAESPSILPRINDDEAMVRIGREQFDKIPAILAGMPTGQIKSRLERGYALALAEKDPAAALRYVKGLATTPVQHDLLIDMGRNLAESNPAGAAVVLGKILEGGHPIFEQSVTQFFPDGQRKTSIPVGLRTTLPDELATHLPERAMEVAMSSDQPAYRQAAQILGDRWMSRDKWAFGNWLNGQPNGDTRDHLTLEYARQIAGGRSPSYAESLAWASSVADSPQRDQRLDEILANWKTKDPAALGVYLAAPETPEVVRTRAEKMKP